MSTPAGWYPDTEATGGERWWDGSQWSHQRRPAANPVVTPTRSMRPLVLKVLTGVGLALVVAAIYFSANGWPWSGRAVDPDKLASRISEDIAAKGGPTYDLACDDIGSVSEGDVTFCRASGVLVRVTFNSSGGYAYESVN